MAASNHHLRQTAPLRGKSAEETVCRGWKWHILKIVCLVSWLIPSACKTVLTSASLMNVTQAPPAATTTVERTVTVHGKIFHGTNTTRGIRGLEVVFSSLSIDSVWEARSSITNASGEYRLVVTERPLYQAALIKDGKAIEVREISLRHSAVDSVGFIQNFWLSYGEPNEEYYRHRQWPKIYFDATRFVLRPASKAILDTIAAILRAEPRLRIVVEGHADQMEAPRGQKNPSHYLSKLGQLRATTVINFLRQQGVPVECLSSISYGSRRPAAPSDTPEVRQVNRKVEIEQAYVEGLEDGYGDLKQKIVNLPNTVFGNSGHSKAHSLAPPARKPKTQRATATPSPNIRASQGKNHDR